VAPSSEVAERIEHAFDTLAIGGPNERLIPDWDPDRRINPDHYRNRETYHLHTQAGAKAASMLDKSDLPTPSLDPESFRKSFAGYQVKLEAITARARQELREQRNEAGDVALYRILDQEPKSPPVTGNREDQPEWLKWQADYGSWLVLVSKELGTMDMTSGDWAISASHGYVERAGIVVSISTLQLDRPVHGVPHLLRWLEDLGCTNFKYRVTRYDADY